MTHDNALEKVEEERQRNLEDAVKHARWEAEMVNKFGAKWFEVRDKWLTDAWEAVGTVFHYTSP